MDDDDARREQRAVHAIIAVVAAAIAIGVVAGVTDLDLRAVAIVAGAAVVIVVLIWRRGVQAPVARVRPKR